LYVDNCVGACPWSVMERRVWKSRDERGRQMRGARVNCVVKKLVISQHAERERETERDRERDRERETEREREERAGGTVSG
jgi:hypothetical protein